MDLTQTEETAKLQLAAGAASAPSPAGLMSAKKKIPERKSNPRLKDVFFFFFDSECMSVCRVRADGIFMYLKRIRCVCV